MPDKKVLKNTENLIDKNDEDFEDLVGKLEDKKKKYVIVTPGEVEEMLNDYLAKLNNRIADSDKEFKKIEVKLNEEEGDLANNNDDNDVELDMIGDFKQYIKDYNDKFKARAHLIGRILKLLGNLEDKMAKVLYQKRLESGSKVEEGFGCYAWVEENAEEYAKAMSNKVLDLANDFKKKVIKLVQWYKDRKGYTERFNRWIWKIFGKKSSGGDRKVNKLAKFVGDGLLDFYVNMFNYKCEKSQIYLMNHYYSKNTSGIFWSETGKINEDSTVWSFGYSNSLGDNFGECMAYLMCCVEKNTQSKNYRLAQTKLSSYVNVPTKKYDLKKSV